MIALDQVASEGDDIISVSYDHGWIYYVKNNEIWKVRPDGKEKQKISMTDPKSHSISEIIANQDKLYFISHEDVHEGLKGDLLYTVNLDGKNLKVLSDSKDVLHINIAGGRLFYSINENVNKQALFEIDTSDSSYQSKQVMESSQLGGFQIVNDWVYYIYNDRLHKQKLEGTDHVQIGNEPCDSFLIYKERIYYEHDGQVFRMNIDGSYPQFVTGTTDPSLKMKFIRYDATSDFVYSFEKNDRDHKLQLKVTQLNLLPTVPTETKQAATDNANNSTTYEELKKLYDQLLTENTSILIGDLNKKEESVTGGSELFPNDHVIGVLKSLIFGLTHGNKEFLRGIVQNTKVLDDLFAYSEVFRMSGKANGGYTSYSIHVEKDNTATITGGNVTASVSLVKIGNQYYVDKMTVSELQVK